MIHFFILILLLTIKVKNTYKPATGDKIKGVAQHDLITLARV